MLSTGRQIAESGHIPCIDTWSHTAYGQPWVMHEWLSSFALYGLFKGTGFKGIVIAKCLLIILLFGVGMSAGYVRGVSPLVALLVFSFAVMAGQVGYSERIQLLTFFGLVVGMFLIDLLEKQAVSRWLWGTIVVLGFALWANLHLGLLAGFMILSFYCLDRAVWGLRKGEWKPFLAAVTGLVLALVAVLVNPYGFDLVKPFLKFYFDPRLKEFDNLILRSIYEYTSTFSPSIIGDAPVKWGIAWLVFSGAGMALNWRKFRVFHGLVWAGFFYFAFYSVRYLPMLVFATMGFTAGNWAEILSRISTSKREFVVPGFLKNVFFLSSCLGVMLGGAGSFFSTKPLEQPLGLKNGSFPVRGVEFVKKDFPNLRILNDFIDGGYLIWNGLPVFIDGRLAPFRGILGDYISIIKGDFMLLEKYGIELALLRYPRSGKSLSFRLPRYFSESSEWALVYWDDVCLVFVKRTAANQRLVASREYRYLNPIRAELSAPLTGFLDELSRKYSEDSTSVALHLSAFEYFYHRDIATAEQFVRRGLTFNKNDASLYNNLGNIYLTKGDMAGATGSYLKAIALDKNISEAYCNLGYIYERGGDYKKAEGYYLKVLKDIDPLNVWVYNRMGLMLAARGDYARAKNYLEKGAAIDPQSEAALNLLRLKTTE
jgi:Flp pilus assembly protein TadD